MHLSTVAAAGLLTLAALTPAEANAQRDAPYRAQGTEPFWEVLIGTVAMQYKPAEGRVVRVGKPKPIVGFNGEIYRTPRLTVHVTHVKCSDGMSDREYPDTVTVTVGRRTLRGCGGGGLAPAQPSPVAGEWRVVTVAGRPVVRGSSPTIAFRGDRVSGNTGCNSFNGGYRFDRGGLTTGPIAATKRACIEPPIGQQEQAMLGMLGQPLRVTKMRNGGVVLRAGRGQTMVLARAGGQR